MIEFLATPPPIHIIIIPTIKCNAGVSKEEENEEEERLCHMVSICWEINNLEIHRDVQKVCFGERVEASYLYMMQGVFKLNKMRGCSNTNVRGTIKLGIDIAVIDFVERNRCCYFALGIQIPVWKPIAIHLFLSGVVIDGSISLDFNFLETG